MVPRQFCMRKVDFKKHGYSSGCKGCRALLKGTSRQGHSEECRRRMERAMEGDPRVTAAKEKIDDFLAKALEAEERGRQEKDRKREGGDEEREDAKRQKSDEGADHGREESSKDDDMMKVAGGEEEEERDVKRRRTSDGGQVDEPHLWASQ